jgi:hypothetical protein
MDPNPYQSPRHPRDYSKQELLESYTGQPLCIEFDLTFDDFVAFNVAHRSHAALLKWLVIILLVIGWVSVPLKIAVELYLNWTGHLPEPMASEEVTHLLLYAALHSILFPLLTCWVYPVMAWLIRTPFHYFLMRLLIRWMLAAGDTSSLFGHYKLMLTAEQLHEQGPKNETTYKISAVQKLRTTRQHLFIYVSPLQAYIVPSRAFPTPEDFTQFVRTLEAWTQQKVVEC